MHNSVIARFGRRRNRRNLNHTYVCLSYPSYQLRSYSSISPTYKCLIALRLRRAALYRPREDDPSLSMQARTVVVDLLSLGDRRLNRVRLGRLTKSG